MVWKKKQKPLSPQEALALVTQQLTPYWAQSPPIIAGIWVGDHADVHPLLPEFNQFLHLLFFVDLTLFSMGDGVKLFEELCTRFKDVGVHFILVLHTPFPELATAQVLQAVREKLAAKYPMVIDLGNALTSGYGVKSFPAAVVCAGGKSIGQVPLDQTEEVIRQLLWKSDPGLSLFSPIHLGPLSPTTGSLDVHSHGGLLKFQGPWEIKENHAVSLEDDSSVEFQSQGDRVTLIATPVSTWRDQTTSPYIWMKLNNGPVFENQKTEILKFAESGECYFPVRALPYHPILKFSAGGTVSLRGKGVTFYGLRFSTS